MLGWGEGKIIPGPTYGRRASIQRGGFFIRRIRTLSRAMIPLSPLKHPAIDGCDVDMDDGNVVAAADTPVSTPATLLLATCIGLSLG